MTENDTTSRDVVIMGGGLAGLCLALQLKKRLPALKILVVERRRHPVPEATHKVGESSVEIAANYFDTVLGLKEHLQSRQLKKFGFRFFFSDGRSEIDNVLEVGASRFLYTPSYQIDRGIFENFLGETVRAQGIDFVDDAVIRSFDLREDGEPHSITYTCAQQQFNASAPWIIDATGRAGMIKRRLKLDLENGHDANAVWFRIGSRIAVDDWSINPAWQERCTPRARWLSTNHLIGKGYWVWLIPLASGSHSVGIVADSQIHPSTSLDTFDKVLVWLEKHQPRLAKELHAKRDKLQDFAYLRRFSYSCKQLFSGNRWALTGEAGVFLDPFYSPGSDFIAISNTYITDLVARDFEGESIESLARIYERFFMSFYDSTMSLYKHQYPMFGNAEIFPIKIIWDYTYYWGILCQIFFQRRLTDLRILSALSEDLELCRNLNFHIQALLRSWSNSSRDTIDNRMIDHAAIDWFAELNRGLRDELDDEGFTLRIRESTQRLQALAAEITKLAQGSVTPSDWREIIKLIESSAEYGQETNMLRNILQGGYTERQMSAAATTAQ